MDGIFVFLIVWALGIVLTGWAREKRGGQFIVGGLLGVLLGPVIGLIIAVLLPPTKGEQQKRSAPPA